MQTLSRWVTRLAAIATLSIGLSTITDAQEIYAGRYGQESGEQLYQGICQGCHMSDAKGAVGAGTYPPLADDPRLAAAIYPMTVVINGQRAMPAFGRANPPFAAALTDVQIANVLNYVRTHFGNQYQDAISPDAVRATRHRTNTPRAAPAVGKDKVSANH
jgi:mono/diheme cytochrome c family protein